MRNPDRVDVPPGRIAVITEDSEFDHLPIKLIKSLRGNVKREGFVPHSYHCLPLVMGSQMGFIVKSLYPFGVYWEGGDSVQDVIVEIPPTVSVQDRGWQVVSSHFGMGTVTIQNRWTFRTPKGVNLLIVPPPNFFLDGIGHLTAVVETDYLRRDFTFNLKITRPKTRIEVPAGTPIGCILPYPRHYIDPFRVIPAGFMLTDEGIAAERAAMKEFGEARRRDAKNPHGNGNLYRNGLDVYGNKFPDHQKALDKE